MSQPSLRDLRRWGAGRWYPALKCRASFIASLRDAHFANAGASIRSGCETVELEAGLDATRGTCGDESAVPTGLAPLGAGRWYPALKCRASFVASLRDAH